MKSYVTENVIQKLLAHKAADSSQTVALVECMNYTDCWQIYTGTCLRHWVESGNLIWKLAASAVKMQVIQIECLGIYIVCKMCRLIFGY